MRRDEWERLHSQLSEAFRDGEPLDAAAAFEMLWDVDTGYVAAALGALSAASKVMPTAAAIRAAAIRAGHAPKESAPADGSKPIGFREWIRRGAPGYAPGPRAALDAWRALGVDPSKLADSAPW